MKSRLKIFILVVCGTLFVVVTVKAATIIGNNITTTGRIGIGTTTPQTNLHIFDGQANVALTLEGFNPMLRFSTTNGSVGNKNWALYSHNDTFRGTIAEDGWANGDMTWLDVYRNGQSQVTSVNFPNGNIGIGTTTPGQSLHIFNSISSGPFIQIDGGGPGIKFTDNDSGVKNKNMKMDVINGNLSFSVSSDDWLGGQTWFSTTRSNETMRYVSFDAGNLGVGTTTPQAKLTVRGDGGGGEFLVLDNSDIPTFIVDGSGNVGIGTSTPEALFHVYKNNATTTVELGGTDGSHKGTCLKLRDSSGAGWTYCTALNGSLNCSQSSCE